jgi:hypothetical protein
MWRPSPASTVGMLVLLAGCATQSINLTDGPAPLGYQQQEQQQSPSQAQIRTQPETQEQEQAQAKVQEEESAVSIVPRLGYWRPSLDGHFLVTKASAPGTGTPIDVQDDLGVDPANAWSAGVDVFLHEHRFQFSYDRAAFQGSTTIDESFIYHGADYPAGTHVGSELTFGFWRATYDYPIWQTDLTELRLGGGLCYCQFTSELSGAPGVEKRAFNQLLPAIDASFDVGPSPWRVGVSSLVGTAGNDRELIDVDAHVGVWLGKNVDLDVGYRWMIVDFREGTNDLDLMLTGPRASLSIRF